MAGRRRRYRGISSVGGFVRRRVSAAKIKVKDTVIVCRLRVSLSSPPPGRTRYFGRVSPPFERHQHRARSQGDEGPWALHSHPPPSIRSLQTFRRQTIQCFNAPLASKKRQKIVLHK